MRLRKRETEKGTEREEGNTNYPDVQMIYLSAPVRRQHLSTHRDGTLLLVSCG